MGPKLLPMTQRPGETQPGRIWGDAERLGGPVIWMQRSEITRGFADAAMAFMRRAVDAEQPFFVNIWPDDVHSPFWPPVDDWAEDKEGKYLSVLEAMDAQFARVFGYVRSTPALRDNTLVLFTSDNGSARERQGSNLPLRGRKGRTDEGGMRVPCVVRWPGNIPAGTHSGALTSTLDLLPTLAHLAGGTAPDRVIDGKNIWPILSGKSKAHPREAFYYYQMDQLQAVRSGDWKLFVPMASKKRNWGKPEGKKELKLFNLVKDIGESTNVAAANPKVVKQLLAYAENARKELGDVNRPGKGQRKAGWVDKASPRLLAQ